MFHTGKLCCCGMEKHVYSILAKRYKRKSRKKLPNIPHKTQNTHTSHAKHTYITNACMLKASLMLAQTICNDCRAGASLPSCSNGVIFLYTVYIYIYTLQKLKGYFTLVWLLQPHNYVHECYSQSCIINNIQHD